jgi:hypothetical protein
MFFDHDAIAILLQLHHLNHVNLHDIPHKNKVILTIVSKVMKVKKKEKKEKEDKV